jgi:hypothetical protein
MPDIVSDDDSLPGLIDDSDSDDDPDVTIRHVRDVFHGDQESTQSKRVEDNLSYVLDSMANVNVACNPELVVHLRVTDVAGLRWIGLTTKLENIGTHPLWGDVFIDRSQPYNILSLHQAQVHSFRELTSQDQQRKILSNPERSTALVFHKDDTDKFYKLHASKVVEYIRKVYYVGLQDVYCESRVYNAAHFYTLDQQQRAQEAIRLHQAFNHPSDKAHKQGCNLACVTICYQHQGYPYGSPELSCYLWSMSSLS